MKIVISIILFHLTQATTDTCQNKCITAGHCCVGLTSACSKPSCAMGCFAAAATKDMTESSCNNTCVTAGNSSSCTYTVPTTSTTFQMCSSCPVLNAPKWWPTSAIPPHGTSPSYWPPGYSLGLCSSCDAIDGDKVGECKLGCMFHFRPGLVPVPPVPTPPPPPRNETKIEPPCGPMPSTKGGSQCVVGKDLNFSNVFSDHAVLQMGPAKAAVYGYLGSAAASTSSVIVTVVKEDDLSSYTVNASVNIEKKTWKAFLTPEAKPGGNYTITVKCTSGCQTSMTLNSITFGNVWYCGGQSNMALPFQYTYARNTTISEIQNGKYGDSDIRITGLKGNMNADLPWTTINDAVQPHSKLQSPLASKKATPGYNTISLDMFSSTCLYFGISLYKPAGSIPIGLIHTAWGGSTIEEWVTNEDIADCKGSGVASDNERLYDTAILPYVDMTLKGWIFYQGENNCHGLHGNSGTSTQPSSGYACLMPKLVNRWRKEWSVVDGTTNTQAAFGVVSLSAKDSEGASDMASFRWSQQGSYGTLPNKIMPNTFMAHAHDLSDPWNGNTGACLATPNVLPGYDCRTPW